MNVHKKDSKGSCAAAVQWAAAIRHAVAAQGELPFYPNCVQGCSAVTCDSDSCFCSFGLILYIDFCKWTSALNFSDLLSFNKVQCISKRGTVLSKFNQAWFILCIIRRKESKLILNPVKLNTFCFKQLINETETFIFYRADTDDLDAFLLSCNVPNNYF